MKTVLFLIAFTSVAQATPAIVYDCGGMTVTLWKENKNNHAYLQFKSENTGRMISISTDQSSVPDAKNDSDILSGTGLSVDSVMYTNFRYGKNNEGDQYIPEEGDTNEAWYAFVIDKEALSAKKSVKAGDYYYSDFRSADTNQYHCKLKK